MFEGDYCPNCDPYIKQLETALATRELEAKEYCQIIDGLRGLVNRMFVHCTVEKGEMTQAEFDDWLTQAALTQEGE